MKADQAAFNRTVLLSAAAALTAGLAAALFLAGPARIGALGGVGVSAASGVLGLFLIRKSLERPLAVMLKAIVTTFLTRLVLVALGLVAVVRWWSKDSALAFAVAFFALFVLLQGIEFTYALRPNRNGGTS